MSDLSGPSHILRQRKTRGTRRCRAISAVKAPQLHNHPRRPRVSRRPNHHPRLSAHTMRRTFVRTPQACDPWYVPPAAQLSPTALSASCHQAAVLTRADSRQPPSEDQVRRRPPALQALHRPRRVVRVVPPGGRPRACTNCRCCRLTGPELNRDAGLARLGRQGLGAVPRDLLRQALCERLLLVRPPPGLRAEMHPRPPTGVCYHRAMRPVSGGP